MKEARWNCGRGAPAPGRVPVTGAADEPPIDALDTNYIPTRTHDIVPQWDLLTSFIILQPAGSST